MTPVRRQRTQTASELAMRFHVHPRTVRRHIAEHRADYEARATSRRDTALALYDTGASWAVIADAINGSEWAARSLVKQAKARRMPASSQQTADGLQVQTERNPP